MSTTSILSLGKLSLGEIFDHSCDQSDESSAHEIDIKMIGDFSLSSLDHGFLPSDCSIEVLPVSQRFESMSTSYSGSDNFDACMHSCLSLLGSSFSLPQSAYFTASGDDLLAKSECDFSPSTMHGDFACTQPLTIWSRDRDELSHPKAVEQKPSGMAQPKSRFLNLHVNIAVEPHDLSLIHI